MTRTRNDAWATDCEVEKLRKQETTAANHAATRQYRQAEVFVATFSDELEQARARHGATARWRLLRRRSLGAIVARMDRSQAEARANLRRLDRRRQPR